MSDYFNGIDFVFGFQFTPPPPSYSDSDYEPDYSAYIDECDYYAEALSVDEELAEAFEDDRIEWFETDVPELPDDWFDRHESPMSAFERNRP